ncbi:hypothetical protein LBMAG43_10520 [Methylococcaceae bacterium]|nr:hypothetical protein LBMAG43_10520 [Methylococcaceae bacterium]
MGNALSIPSVISIDISAFTTGTKHAPIAEAKISFLNKFMQIPFLLNFNNF